MTPQIPDEGTATSLSTMGDGEGEADEAPATWENELVGEAKKIVGRAIGDDGLTEAGEEQVEIAHEVREEYEHKPDDPRQDN
jgi:uncharacterized protein YjbJ (UPF0337 family)